MDAIAQLVGSSLPAGTPFLALLVLKATLLLAAAGGVALALRSASAATRHLVWTLAVAALVALPLLSLLLPSWGVPVRLGVEAPAAFPAAPPAAPELSDFREAQVWVGAPTALPAPATEEAAGAPAAASPPARIPLGVGLLALWAAGAGVLLLRLAVGWWGVRRLERTAEPVTDPEWTELVRDLAWMLEVDRPVRLLRSERAAMPLTWGTRRPAVLLPAAADGWDAERRRVVLLHELAHVARRDCLTQAVAGVACALYWFHPLAWYAAGRLRAERERACDDRVLSAGARAAEYAGHLLEVARSFRPHRLAGAAAIAMARPSQLEGRLLAVLDAARSRRVPGPAARAAGAVLAALLLLPLATLRTEGARAAETQNVATLPAAYVHAPAVRAPQERVRTAEFAARPGGKLVLDLDTGGDVEVTGWDREQVSVRAVLEGRDWRDSRVSFDQSGRVVRVASRQEGSGRGSRTSHSFEVRVPSRFDVEVRSAGGEVEIEGVRGTFTGATGGGELRLARLHGEARLTTGGGEVSVTDSRLSGTVRTGGGEVTLRNVQGGLRGYTGGGRVQVVDSDASATSGSEGHGHSYGGSRRGAEDSPQARAVAMARAGERVRVQAPGGALSLQSAPAGAEISTGGGAVSIGSSGRDVQVRTGGGAIAVGRSEGPVNARTGSGAVSVGSTRGRVEVVTGNGAVSVGPAQGSVRAVTGNGAVSVRVAGGAGERDVEVTSGRGEVTVVLPADFSGEFEVETAYTRGHGPVRIHSDFPLRQTESGRESRGGTPRRTVRATGRTGSGTHRVRVRTVNGDVHLRRAGAGSSRAPAVRQAPAPRPAIDPDSLEIIVEEAVKPEGR